MKIGQYVRDVFRTLHEDGFISERIISDLTRSKYCFKMFKTKFPVLIHKDQDPVDSKGYRRYYSSETFCGGYQLSSQWYENQRKLFDSWKDMLKTTPASNKPIVVEEDTSVITNKGSKKSSIFFRDLYSSFLKTVSSYSGYTFSNMNDMMEYYHQTNDDFFCDKYYMLISIRKARNVWAHPETGYDQELIIVGEQYMKIILRHLNEATNR